MSDRREHLESVIRSSLASRDADAFVQAGRPRTPSVRYCLPAAGSVREYAASERHAVAFDGAEWLISVASDGSDRPAERLVSMLVEREVDGTVLTPRTLPHDAALYLERGGLSLASTDAVARARATKTTSEVEAIERAQAAASAGIRRAAAILDDGVCERAGDPITPADLRIAVDEAIVAAGAFPGGRTSVETSRGVLQPGDPIVVSVAPREPTGYHGGLARTLIVEGDGGRERRVQIALTHAFRSARALLTAGTQSVHDVEADLEAEIRAFGFDDRDGIETRAKGVGLEPRERPSTGNDEIASGSVIRLEAAVGGDGDEIRIADLLWCSDDGPQRVDAPPRSLEPATLCE